MASGHPTLESARRIFSGKLVGLTIERWNGAEREVVERADSVAVVAVDRDDRVVLVRQFRAPARDILVELPAGTVGEGEDPLATAKRELAEETGLHGGCWRRGPVFYSSPGFVRERIHLFFATALEPGKRSPDTGEELELVRWPAAEVRSRLREIKDGKTLAGLLSYALEHS